MKIEFVPTNPLSVLFGGFELQMIDLMNGMRSAGADVSIIDLAQKNNVPQIYHVWGMGGCRYDWLEVAKKKGVKICFSILLNYYDTLDEQARYWTSRIAGPMRDLHKKMSIADGVFVVNQRQADVAARYLNIDPAKIFIAPVTLPDCYFSRMPLGRGVITTGNICQRKNQLILARVCDQLKIPLTIIGHRLETERDYAEELGKVCSKSSVVRWIPGLERTSPELIDEYRRASVFALPSFNETQPTSALEAAALGLGLVLGIRGYAKQDPFRRALRVAPSSFDALSGAIKKAVDSPLEYGADISMMTKYKTSVVSEYTLASYRKIMSM